MPLTLERLRRHALVRSLFAPTTLKRAIHKLGFVQADPIRAPARAQDPTLRQRVRDYRAGDLERRYALLGVAEDFFVNYGFLPLAYYALPLLWRDAVIGWGNLAITKSGTLDARLGYAAGRAPCDAVFRRELDAELARIETFVSGG